jgi:hypothetical protein
MVTTLITGIRSLKIPGPGAVAHMSLHLNQQCQRATDKSSGQPVTPVLIRGTRCPSMLATGEWEAVETVSTPSVEWPLRVDRDSVKRFLQFCCARPLRR